VDTVGHRYWLYPLRVTQRYKVCFDLRPRIAASAVPPFLGHLLDTDLTALNERDVLASQSDLMNCQLLALRQRLPDAGLRNSKLPCDCRRPDTPALKAARTAFSLPVAMDPRQPRRLTGAAAALRQLMASLSPGTATSRGDSHKQRIDFHITSRFSVGKSFGKKWRCCEARLSAWLKQRPTEDASSRL
jgi:hypothetical protein